MAERERAERAFQARFGSSPALLVRAPGRVNLIGEHTDYNDGFVLPIAIDREVWIALRPRSDARVLVRSLDYEAEAELELAEPAHSEQGWAEYIGGCAWALRDARHELKGWEGVIGGDVPRGAGLSSSAAIELATLRAFAAVAGLAWDAKAMALLGQRVENAWVGVSCGIMDQLIVAAGQAGHALLIDCRSLEIAPAPLPPGVAVVVLDTGTRRGLVDSAYNERRRQCEEAAAFFGVKALRDVDLSTFSAREAQLDPTARKRARHVVTENARTVEAARALRAGDVEHFGRLMDASHASLRDDFEVTNEALDTIVGIARQQAGCLGARMTGAGFGGCAVALVRADAAPAFIERLVPAYRGRTELEPQVYVCSAADGASVQEAALQH
ncbi:MAG TPA: galactokinase [Longimicrobiales bacterium]